MSKIICDVCGTSYSETATQCPICGCVRPSDVTVVSGDTSSPEAVENGTYSHVKGGRFSKSNVRRRTHNRQGAVPVEHEDEPAEPKTPKSNRDTGLVVAVCVLLLAIVSAVIYIAIHFFSQVPAEPTPENTWQNATEASTTIAATTTTNEIACTDILVSKTAVEFTEVGAFCDLVVTKNPADTTDTLLFVSSNEAVAKVSADGKIEAVGDGEAVISITCGSAMAECKVTCKITVEETIGSTEATNSPETEGTPEETGAYKISHTDVTLNLNGEAHLKSFRLTLKDSNDTVKDVKWVVGDPSVCEVSGNTVTGIKAGYTKVKATVDGVTYECIVRVR